MIIGAHVMLHSRDEAADRAFLSDVLKFGSVDAGGGSVRRYRGCWRVQCALSKNEHTTDVAWIP